MHVANPALLLSIQLPPASTLHADHFTDQGFERASFLSFFLSLLSPPLSWKSVELGQDDLNSV